ncbi:hypothetical protein GCM10027456_14060 [Kineosporia babensis]
MSAKSQQRSDLRPIRGRVADPPKQLGKPWEPAAKTAVASAGFDRRIALRGSTFHPWMQFACSKRNRSREKAVTLRQVRSLYVLRRQALHVDHARWGPVGTELPVRADTITNLP